jgi:hypothetical protein
VFPAVNRAILLRVGNDTALEFGEVLSLPGGQSKFALVWDAVSAAFVSLVNVNAVLPRSPHAGVDCAMSLDDCADQRNELSVVASRDLRRWVVAVPKVRRCRVHAVRQAPLWIRFLAFYTLCSHTHIPVPAAHTHTHLTPGFDDACTSDTASVAAAASAAVPVHGYSHLAWPGVSSGGRAA